MVRLGVWSCEAAPARLGFDHASQTTHDLLGPSTPPDQFVAQGYLQMSQAQSAATAAALTHLGYTIGGKDAGAVAREEITPISDVRGSRDFRLQLAENVLRKFYYDVS